MEKKIKVDYKTPLKIQLKELGIEIYLNLEEIKNLYPPSKDGYIYDVENGKEMTGKSPEECEKEFKTKGRRALTVHEVLAIYRKDKKVLESHYIDCSGSRFGSSGGVPYLYLCGGRPELVWVWADVSSSEWGSASCGSRDLDIGNLELLETRLLDLEQKMNKIEKVLRF